MSCESDNNLLKSIFNEVITFNELFKRCALDNHLYVNDKKFTRECDITFVASNCISLESSIFDMRCLIESYEGNQHTTQKNFLDEIYFNDNKDLTKELIPINYAVEYLRSSFALKLRQVFGDVFFSRLLKKCAIFLFLENGCYEQKFGCSIENFIWSSQELKADERAIYKFNNEISKFKLIKQILKETEKSDKKRSFNECNDCETKRSSLMINPSKRLQTSINRKQMLYSRQFGKWKKSFILSFKKVDSSTLMKTIFHDLTNSFRDKNEISSLLKQVIINHKNCRFINLLNHHCALDKDFVKVPYELRKAVSQFTSYKNVVTFLRAVLRFVFPIRLFGESFEKIFQGIKSIVASGLNTSMNLLNLNYGTILVSCQWVKSVNNQQKQSLVDAFLVWITDYVITLIQTFFYVTETSFCKSKLFYYRYDLWQKMEARAINERIANGDFKPLTEMEISDILSDNENDTLIFSSIRYIPKSSGFRIINPLKPADKPKKKMMALLLKSLLPILKKVAFNIDNNANTSFLSLFQSKIKKLKNTLTERREKKLFYIRADIVDCYPSINQAKLLEIINSQLLVLARNGKIFLGEFDIVRKVERKLFAKHIRYVKQAGDIQSLSSLIDSSCTTFPKNCLLIPKKFKKTYGVGQLIDVLSCYLQNAIIKSGSNNYHLTKGIRQGGILSSVLCNIYMNSLMNDYFGKSGERDDEVRLVTADDFVFITTDEKRAKELMQIVLKGFSDYNLKVNLDKTQSNLSSGGTTLWNSSDYFTFFGYEIDTNSLNLRADYSIYSKTEIQYTFNCNSFITLESITRLLSS